MQTLSLFTGAGGLDVGFERAGFHVAECVESDAACVATLRANRPAWHIRQQDIRRYEPAADLRIDVITAGPPCQGYASGGRRAATDWKNTLSREVVRIAQILRPRAVVIENVPGITNMYVPNRKCTFAAQLSRALRNLGYHVRTLQLDLSLYGVPQRRKRVFFVATQNRLPVGTLRFTAHPGRICDWIPRTTAAHAIRRADRHGGRKHGIETSMPTIDCGRFMWCTPAGDRLVTTAELARLQTFDTDWQFKGSATQILSQIANAVPPHFATQLGQNLYAVLTKEKACIPERNAGLIPENQL